MNRRSFLAFLGGMTVVPIAAALPAPPKKVALAQHIAELMQPLLRSKNQKWFKVIDSDIPAGSITWVDTQYDHELKQLTEEAG